MLTFFLCLVPSPRAQLSGGLEQGLRSPTAFLLADRRLEAQTFFLGAASNLPGSTRQAGLRLAGGFFGRAQLGLAFWSLNPGKTEFAADLAFHPLAGTWKGFDFGAGVRHLGTGPRQGPRYTSSFQGSSPIQDHDQNVPSPYLVISRRLDWLFDASLGWGQGEFLGWGPLNKVARGLFGSARLHLRSFAFVGEFDGRSLNTGLELNLPKDLRFQMGLLSIENLRVSPRETNRRPGWALALSWDLDLGRPQRARALASLERGRLRMALSRPAAGILRLDAGGLRQADMAALGIEEILMHILRPGEGEFKILRFGLAKNPAWPLKITLKETPPEGSLVYLTARKQNLDSDPSRLVEWAPGIEKAPLFLPLPPSGQPQGPAAPKLLVKTVKGSNGNSELEIQAQAVSGEKVSSLRLFADQGSGEFLPVGLKGGLDSSAFKVSSSGRRPAFYLKALDAQGREGPPSAVVVASQP